MENILIIRTETQLIAVPSRKPMQAILLDSLCSLEEYEYRSSVARRNREPSIHFRTILLDSPPKGGSLEEYEYRSSENTPGSRSYRFIHLKNKSVFCLLILTFFGINV